MSFLSPCLTGPSPAQIQLLKPQVECGQEHPNQENADRDPLVKPHGGPALRRCHGSQQAGNENGCQRRQGQKGPSLPIWATPPTHSKKSIAAMVPTDKNPAVTRCRIPAAVAISPIGSIGKGVEPRPSTPVRPTVRLPQRNKRPQWRVWRSRPTANRTTSTL